MWLMFHFFFEENIVCIPQCLWWVHPINQICGQPGKGDFTVKCKNSSLILIASEQKKGWLCFWGKKSFYYRYEVVGMEYKNPKKKHKSVKV